MSHFEPITVTFPVRYSECDPLGIAHHSSYVIWFEEARHEYRRRHQADYDQLAEEGVFMPLAELRARYRTPARFGDIITVRSWMTEVKSRRATFYHEVRHADSGEILAEGETVHICFDVETGELRRIPPRVRGLLQNYLKTEESGNG
ncbi:MAG: acyl-CoA thioesterase [Anaerolineae bacterium]